MEDCEFDYMGMPTARRGLTSVEAATFLAQEQPEIKNWMMWSLDADTSTQQIKKIPAGKYKSGKIGKWSWTRVPIKYPILSHWYCRGDKRETDNWTGLIEVTSDEDEFLLFSFVSSSGFTGRDLMSSTHDTALLMRFAHDVADHYNDLEEITISVFNGPDIRLDPAAEAPIFMKQDVREDIEAQADSFFADEEEFKKHDLRYRRGFLFVGPPGTGKTMMIRELIRRLWIKYKPTISALRPQKNMDEHTLDVMFSTLRGNEKAIIIMEDMDTLLKQTEVTRAGLLSHLDGLDPRTGFLLLASTNNPEEIDPALVHRPSRFDRVWHFGLPDESLRAEYLKHAFGKLSKTLLGELAEGTSGWSFAYLNELKTTAAILAITEKRNTVSSQLIQKSYDLLAAQFHAGKKNHVTPSGEAGVGFRVA